MLRLLYTCVEKYFWIIIHYKVLVIDTLMVFRFYPVNIYFNQHLGLVACRVNGSSEFSLRRNLFDPFLPFTMSTAGEAREGGIRERERELEEQCIESIFVDDDFIVTQT